MKPINCVTTPQIYPVVCWTKLPNCIQKLIMIPQVYFTHNTPVFFYLGKILISEFKFEME